MASSFGRDPRIGARITAATVAALAEAARRTRSW